MNEKKFAALVERLERESRNNPTSFRLRVALWASLGYLTWFGLLIAVLTIILFTFVTQGINAWSVTVVLIPLGIAVILLRSLPFRLNTIEGLELSSDRY